MYILKSCEKCVYLTRIDKLPGREISHANTITWSYDMESHAKKCVDRYCELANKTVENLYKVLTLCLDDHQLKRRNWKRLENYPRYAFRLS